MAEEKKTTTRKRTTTPKTAEKVVEEEKVETAAPVAEQTEDLASIKAAYEAQIAEMKKAMQEQMDAFKDSLSAMQKPQVVQVTASTEQVHFLWMADVADDNIQDFGPGGMYGRIIGKTGEFFVPKNDLSRILDNITRMCMARRWLIVVDGLNEDEREAMGVNYQEGELLDRKAFAKLVEQGDKILEIFPALCEGHKEMVGKRFYEAWTNHSPHINRERIVALNKMAKEAGMKENAFTEILKEMNEKDAE